MRAAALRGAPLHHVPVRAPLPVAPRPVVSPRCSHPSLLVVSCASLFGMRLTKQVAEHGLCYFGEAGNGCYDVGGYLSYEQRIEVQPCRCLGHASASAVGRLFGGLSLVILTHIRAARRVVCGRLHARTRRVPPGGVRSRVLCSRSISMGSGSRLMM